MKLISTRMLCAAVLALAWLSALAADPFPSKPIKIVVYVGPGTLVDVTTRMVAEKLSEQLKQQVVVENIAGASGLLGIRNVKAQPADGYTILAATNTVAQAPVLTAAPGYELKDFAGIGAMNQAPLLLVGPVDQPDKTLPQLLARAKANPDALSWASGGIGTTTWLSGTMLLNEAGARMVHVPYKGTGAAMPDVISGRINMIFDAESSAGPHIREGRLRGYAVSSTRRLATFPDVPTVAEQGLPNYSLTIYNGLMARAETPKDVVQRLEQALQAALASDAVRERFRRDGTEPLVLSGSEFTEFLSRDSQRIAKLAAEMGLQKQ